MTLFQVCEFSWFATQWSVCSSECSGLKGVQTRKVFCASVDANNTIKIEDESSCDETKKLVPYFLVVISEIVFIFISNELITY